MDPCGLHQTMKESQDKLEANVSELYGYVHKADAEIVALKMRVDQREVDLERLEVSQEKAIAKLEGMIQGMTSQIGPLATQMHGVIDAIRGITDLTRRVSDLENAPGRSAKAAFDNFKAKAGEKLAWVIIGAAILYGVAKLTGKLP